MTNGEWIVQNNYSFTDIYVEEIGNELYAVSFTRYGRKYEYNTDSTVNAVKIWLDEEHKDEVLEPSERKYLATVIKPFREKVPGIAKYEIGINECIIIYIPTDHDIELPKFAKAQNIQVCRIGNIRLRSLAYDC